MKICVFGAASAMIDEKYVKAVEQLGEKMAKRGHSLVFGCGRTGLMGAVSRGVKRGGGKMHGVVPTFFVEEDVEKLDLTCDEITYTQTMAERKKIMEDDCDAFIIVPGGVGTLEEFYEVLTLKELGRHTKAIAIYNLYGYYDELESFMQKMMGEKFVSPECVRLYKYFTNDDELLDYIDGYQPDKTPWKIFKKG
jgi:hypothetical protein